MPTISEVRQKYPQYEDMSDDQLAGALHKKFYSDIPMDEFRSKIGLEAAPVAMKGDRAQVETRDGKGVLEKIDAGMRGAADFLTLGTADEISAGLGTGFGYLGDYDKELARQRGIDSFDEENNTAARIAGQVAGGVTGGVGMAKSGATLLGRSVPGLSRIAPKATQTGLAAVEGGLYGGAYGFGSGEGEEDRLSQAKSGAVTGAVVGAAAQKIGNSLSQRSANRKMASAAPAQEELARATNELYEASRQAGVTIKSGAMSKLRANIKLSAGRMNDKLRPMTAGIVEDAEELLTKNMSLEELDEFRQVVGQAMQRAQPQDVRTLTLIKNQIDNFADNITPRDITGDIKGFDIIKQARALNARKMKTELVEKILDSADVRSGNYSQSGVANAIKTEMAGLYRKIQSGKVKGFSKEEVELIRTMAKGGTSSSLMRLMAKFSPRGVVSFGGGQVLGSMVPGGNILIPGAGYAAGQSVDRAALGAASTLRNAAASGISPQMNAISQRAGQFIPAAAAESEAVRQRLSSGR